MHHHDAPLTTVGNEPTTAGRYGALWDGMRKPEELKKT